MSLVNCCNLMWYYTKKDAEQHGIDYARDNPIRPEMDPVLQKIYVEVKGKRVYLWSPDQLAIADKKFSKNTQSIVDCALGAVLAVPLLVITQNSPSLKQAVPFIPTLFLGMQIQCVTYRSELLNEYAEQAAAKYIKDHHEGPIEVGEQNPSLSQTQVQNQVTEEEKQEIKQDEKLSITEEERIRVNELAVSSQNVAAPTTEENLTERLLPSV